MGFLDEYEILWDRVIAFIVIVVAVLVFLFVFNGASMLMQVLAPVMPYIRNLLYLAFGFALLIGIGMAIMGAIVGIVLVIDWIADKLR